MARGNGQVRLRCMRCWISKVRSPEVPRDCPKCGRLMRHRDLRSAQLDNFARYGRDHFLDAAKRGTRRFFWYRRLTARQVAL